MDPSDMGFWSMGHISFSDLVSWGPLTVPLTQAFWGSMSPSDPGLSCLAEHIPSLSRQGFLQGEEQESIKIQQYAIAVRQGSTSLSPPHSD